MKPFDTGVVVGKFSPLHLGHEHLIEEAQRQCRKLFLISWSNPEYAGCEARRREAWLRQRFPECGICVLSVDEWKTAHALAPALPRNDADETTSRRFVAFLCENELKIAPDAVFGGEAYIEGFARELGACLGRKVQPVLINRFARSPHIDATTIRADVHKHRNLLSPHVYASFVRRVCLLGGESSGKSELARALAIALETVYVAEFGRELWEQRGPGLTLTDLRQIAQVQVQREERALLQAQRWLVCDTSPLTTLGYCYWMHDTGDAEVARLAERRYDATLLCAPDFEFQQDCTRRGAAFRGQQHRWYLAELERRTIDYHLCSGTLENRVRQARSVLQSKGLQ